MNYPVNYTDSTGHFIDTLWDLYDLGADVAGCLGDSDALSCYMIPLDALAVPGVPGVADNVIKAGRRVDEVSLVRQADSCAFNSFTAGTLVQTEQGLVPIEQIKLGDKVLAQDPKTGATGYFEVVDLTNHPTADILRITVDDDGRDHLAAEVMEVTPEHSIYVEDKGWVLAENLAIGDRLRRADGGWAKVLAIERVRLATPAVVYNFTVKGVHTYFVLEVGVLVHNCVDDDPLVRAARREADLAQKTPMGIPRPGAAGALEVDGKIFTAQSKKGLFPPKLHPEVQKVLDAIPIHKRSLPHGRCVEPQCISQALYSNVDPSGGRSLALIVEGPGKPGHGTPLPACRSCQQLLKEFGEIIDVARR